MQKIEDEFNNLFPNPDCELKYSNNFELLVSVILSAQCTDKRVNSVTKDLFQKLKTPKDFAEVPIEKLEKEIYSLGFYHNKAKNIKNASKEIAEKFNGEVPSDFDKLVSLAGVGRKTASVVMAVGFDKPAFAVDTHVFRVANRLGIGSEKSVDECEKSLKNYFDKDKWQKVHLQMVHFGRYICKARNPECEKCNFHGICKFYNSKR